MREAPTLRRTFILSKSSDSSILYRPRLSAKNCPSLPVESVADTDRKKAESMRRIRRG